MHTQEIHVTGGRPAVSDIRSRLFAFPEVLDVLARSDPDSLVVVIAGRPRPAEWSRLLRAAGYEMPRKPPRAQLPAPERALADSAGRAALVQETADERPPRLGTRRRSAAVRMRTLSGGPAKQLLRGPAAAGD